jgi:A/G-specific adenine glycosylase
MGARARPATLKPARAAALLTWFDRHRRVLPWRTAAGETPDPYRVWLSEIMLQQTTVATVAPRWRKFLEAFPDVATLAAAPWEQVAAAWAGLGYYARARNLHAAAQIIAAKGFPADEAGWRRLPGVGAYTAAAIAAIAHGQPSVPVDGNVERVMARLYAIGAPLPAAKRALAEAATALLREREARTRPGDAVQALFDLGAIICTPRRPACVLCPLADYCAGRAAGIQASLPAKPPRKPRPALSGAVFWIEDASRAVWLRRRPPHGLLGGMLELPGTEWLPDMTIAEALGFAPVAAPWRMLGEVAHVFTHFSLRLSVLGARVAALAPPPAAGFLIAREEVLAAGLPSVMAKAARLALAAGDLSRPR